MTQHPVSGAPSSGDAAGEARGKRRSLVTTFGTFTWDAGAQHLRFDASQEVCEHPDGLAVITVREARHIAEWILARAEGR